MGLFTIADVAGYGRARLSSELGALGAHIAALAHAEDPRGVVTDTKRKSLGSERTFEHNIKGRAAVLDEALPLVDEVAAGLRKSSLLAGGVRLKVKYADFTLVTRVMRLLSPASDPGAILSAIRTLSERLDTDREIRLVGVAATELQAADAPKQTDLFDPARATRDRLAATIDRVKERFGDDAIARASSTVRKRGPKNPW
jgi:DNA polymerase-4